jgi:hypothetical protein
MGGIPGQYFKQFGLTVAIAVIFSLIVARLITPMMAAYLMRAKDAEENRARKEREAAQFRAKAIAQAQEIWDKTLPIAGTEAEAYLALRGIVLPRGLPPVLRFSPRLNYMVQNPDRTAGDKWIVAHCGPAMVSQVVGRDNRLCAVHRTWFDLAAPHGKLRIVHPVTGEVMPRKKMWGSKKGGAIRLVRGFEGNTTMVMGEGIETTLTAMVAGVYPRAAMWAGVDLGNMGGVAARGQGLRYAGVPDLSDDRAFLPPDWVRTLIYLMDGDSEPRHTRAVLVASGQQNHRGGPRGHHRGEELQAHGRSTQ